MPVLLYIDLLGTRAKWHRGGIEESRRAFNHFTSFMIAAARPDISCISDGGIETDSAAFVCSNVVSALQIARRAFLRAFDTPRGRLKERLWLRGVVVSADGVPLRTGRPGFGSASNVSIFTYSPELLSAVSLEKSGFRGMRLLVHKSLLSAPVRQDLALRVEGRPMIPMKRLRHAGYAKAQTDDFQDYLWMASSDETAWKKLIRRMSKRLREANVDPEEFAQAAATQVFFHEAHAIFKSVQSRARQRRNEPAS